MVKSIRLSVFIFGIGFLFWLLGCTPSSQQPFSFEGTLWQLEGIIPIDGTEVSVVQFPAFILTFKDGTVRGQTPCNFFGSSYEVDGSNLDIGEIELTAAACIEDQINQQENLLITGLETIQSYAIEDNQLTLTATGETLIFHAQPDTRGSEVAVYTVLLREWRGEKPGFVIVNDTAFNAHGISLDDTLQMVESQLAPISQGSGLELDPATLADFRSKNETPQPLEGIFPSSFPVSFITNEFLTTLFSGGETSGWETFRTQYPNAIGILTLSRVGFNLSGDQALVSLGLKTESGSGNYYHLLTHSTGFWVNSLGFQLDIPR